MHVGSEQGEEIVAATSRQSTNRIIGANPGQGASREKRRFSEILSIGRNYTIPANLKKRRQI